MEKIQGTENFLKSLGNIITLCENKGGRKNPMDVTIFKNGSNDIFALVRLSDITSISVESPETLKSIVDGFNECGLDISNKNIRIAPFGKKGVFNFGFITDDYQNEEIKFQFTYDGEEYKIQS